MRGRVYCAPRVLRADDREVDDSIEGDVGSEATCSIWIQDLHGGGTLILTVHCQEEQPHPTTLTPIWG